MDLMSDRPNRKVYLCAGYERPGLICFFLSGLVTVYTGRLILYLFSRRICLSITVKLAFIVTVDADHAFLVMDIRCAPVFTGKFRIYPSAVAEVARFPFISLDEFMSFNETDTDPAYCRSFYVAVPAGGVARSA